jgi:putative glycosyltransferase
MKLSIVTTMYHSAPYIQEFYSRMVATALKITNDFEIIFVDDGSPDHSFQIVHALHLNDPKVKIIELSRNFGHHKAIMTGLMHAQGEYVFLIDIDLEEDPELLEKFWHEMQHNLEMDVVYGIQKKRKGRWFEQLTGAVYFKVLNIMSDELKSANNTSIIRLMKKNYVDALIKFQEKGFYFGPISILAGFNQQGLIFTKKSKPETTYHFFKKYHLFIDSVLTFSSKPLYCIFYFGIVMTLLSFSYMGYLVIRKIVWGIALQGWTSLVVLISLFGGITFLFMGVMSLYLLHIYQESKNRPFSIVRKIYDRGMT